MTEDPRSYPPFAPFAATRYDLGRVAVADVVAPPYDVVGPEARDRLEARSPFNAVRLELSRDQDGLDRYAAARGRLEAWLADGVLAEDDQSGFYLYRIGFTDATGQPRQSTGVLGALALDPSGDAVLPHERTLARPRSDRLRLLRACRANLSPIWGLSLAPGLTAACEPMGPPLLRVTDDDGAHHRIWRVTAPAALKGIAATVGSAPVVIADGHHRYETALAYRAERRAANGDRPGGYDRVLALIVELTDDQLDVLAIHRLVSGLPDEFPLLGHLARHFEIVALGDGVGTSPPPTSQGPGPAIGLVLAGATYELRRRPEPTPTPGDGRDAQADSEQADSEQADSEQADSEQADSEQADSEQADNEQADSEQADSEQVGAALVGLPEHTVDHHHSPEEVVARVVSGRAQAGFLLRPVSVARLTAAAHTRNRLPEKSTFFRPKPLTGLVFRQLHD